MGAWGILPFENDNALDWVWQLEEAQDTSVLIDALTAVTSADPDELVEDGEEALAAAEVVAALRGKPLPELPEEVSAFVKQQGNKKPAASLIKLAIQAVKRLGESSDLQSRWDETESAQKWADSLRNLLKRLEL